MKCSICKNGETEKKAASISINKGDSFFIYKNVPAEVCTNCGEQFFDESVTTNILLTASESAKKGTILDIKEYRAT
ncbi:MAG: type II toxin-antitoxin system MqsA family antitoxin [Melioribacteraceae bacterium]